VKNQCKFTEVIAKLKPGYRFLDHSACAETNERFLQSISKFQQFYHVHVFAMRSDAMISTTGMDNIYILRSYL